MFGLILVSNAYSVSLVPDAQAYPNPHMTFGAQAVYQVLQSCPRAPIQLVILQKGAFLLHVDPL